MKTLQDLDPTLDAEVRRLLEATSTPGAAIAVVHGEHEYLSTYGVKRLGEPDPVTPRTAFDAGSCSKSFVATAIALLADEGKLTMDDPVCRYLPEFVLDDPWITANITIRDLLANRTGLARLRPIESFPNAEIDIAEVLRRVRHIPRIRPFRGGYVYFNIGFMACRLIVERVSGLAYPEFMAKRLFGPLGMTDSAMGHVAFETLPDRAQGHSAATGTMTPVPDAIFDNTMGAGCTHVSGADAIPWLRLHLAEADGSGGLVRPETLRQLHRPHTVIPLEEARLMDRPPETPLAAYCLGWRLSSLQGHRIVHHSGGMFGWHVQCSLAPDDGAGVMVMLNAYVHVHEAISYLVQEALMGLPRRDWLAIADAESDAAAKSTAAAVELAFPRPADSAQARPLADYEGVYSHPGAGHVEIERQGETLLAKQMDGRIWDYRLWPIGADVFDSRPDYPPMQDYSAVPTRAQFLTEGGKVTGLHFPPSRYVRL